MFVLSVPLELPSGMIIKDSIKISVDAPEVRIQEWSVVDACDDAVEEYVVPLKLHKKVYKHSIRVRVAMQGGVPEQGCTVYFSCFVVEDEKIRSFSQKFFIEKEKAIRKQIAKPRRDKFFRRDRPIWLVNAKYLFFLLMGLIFIGFLIVDVLSLFEVMSFLGLGAWGYFARFFVPHYVVFFLCAVWLLLFAAWCLVKKSKTTLGLVCASSVLPLLVQAYISFYFS